MATTPWVTWPALTKFGTLGVMAGVLVIGAEREKLLDNNLFETEDLAAANAAIDCDERSLTARTEDGTCNILSSPAEGSIYRRFGRNVDPTIVRGETEADTLLTPNPREVSNVLMARGGDFKPATSLNFIAAAWIQFMIHDWVDHGPNTGDDPIQVPLPPGDPLGSGSLSVRRTGEEPAQDSDHRPFPTYRNHNTHWWDGSQIYGSSKTTNDKLRAFADGKLKVDADNSLPTDWVSGKPITGFSENWWVGLSMMHRLFTQEHNAIAEMLKQKYPDKSDQWLYDHARLINAALMAKIHTVEWTPAIIANPVTERTMYANWWGIGGNRDSRDQYQQDLDTLNASLTQLNSLFQLVGIDTGISSEPGFLDHGLGGLVGSREPTNHGTPYTLTEEFVAVYRMHPLMRDKIDVYDIGSNIVSESIDIEDTRDGDAEEVLDDVGAARMWYSFGITHPGALTLKNYPEFLRNLSIPLVGNIDMATTDILRDRERGVPRYNEFRRQIGLKPITQFEDLTSDAQLVADLKRLYNNNVEMIDTLVGQLAESVRPEGFGFGETAFQIFILNASRRLMTDRFFTSDYRPEIYTQEGIDWVENNTMVDVLKRHYPSLASALVGMDNAFKPWGLNMPANYETWSAATKQEHLWVNGALRTQHKPGQMPALRPIDIGGLIDTILWDKVQNRTDVAPPGYEKPLHPFGAMAKVKFVAAPNNGYTGLFQGADHGFLRLSVTGDPADRGFAPGMALKLFVDGKPSENVSGLYTLSGQGDNYNFFTNELSNYVLTEANESLGTTLLFSLVTTKPTLLVMSDMAKVQQNGTPVSAPRAPTQIFLVPNTEVRNLFPSEPHDFRLDLAQLPEGLKLYDVYATSMDIKTSIIPSINKRYADERRASAQKIGELTMTSAFVASAFGDEGVFFKHQRYEDR